MKLDYARLENDAYDCISAYGPVTFKQIEAYCLEQTPDFTEANYEMLPKAITNLIRDGMVELYDIGDSFVTSSQDSQAR